MTVTIEVQTEMEMEIVGEGQTQMEMEIVSEDRKEMDMEMIPDRYMDIISGEFAYDPVRLPLDQDPTQLLYNRKTLHTIWETERHARNPLTRKWFDIKRAIPQSDLRKEMNHFCELHGFPPRTVIANYSKILHDGEMKQLLITLYEYVKGRPMITEEQWVEIWKTINILRLFCEFHFQNIKLFISLQGFRYFEKVIHQTFRNLRGNDPKDAALEVGKETARAVDVVINGMRSRGVTSMEILGNLEERQSVLLCLLAIVIRVYKNTKGYVKMQSLVLRAFSTIFQEVTDIVHMGRTVRPSLVGYPCALTVLCQNAKHISSEDLNNGIAFLRTVRVSLLNFDPRYVSALVSAVTICISREIESSREMSGFTEEQLIEAQVQARHNSEALEKGVRLIRDIAMEEGQLATCILRRGLDIVKDLVHMFERFTQTENEDDGNRKFPVLICENKCEMVHCVHYRIAQDGLDIAEAISKKQGLSLDVAVLRKFIIDRTRI